MKKIMFIVSLITTAMWNSAALFAEETLTIRTENSGVEEREQQKTDNKVFCSKKSEEDAQQKCQSWLDKQEKNLGDRVLTSFCSEGEISAADGCLYRARGEIKYLLKVLKPAATK